MIRSTTIDTPMPTGALPPARQVVFVFDDLPDWQSTYHYFRLWKQNGTWR